VRANVPVISGAFSFYADLSLSFNQQTCTLIAVPAGAAPDPTLVAPFAHRTWAISQFTPNFNGTLLQDYDFFHYGTTGFADINAFSDCNLASMESITLGPLSGSTTNMRTWQCAGFANGLITPPTPPAAPARGEILVDGIQGHAPVDTDPLKAGAAEVAVTYTHSAVTGNLMIHDVEPLVKCVPSEASCDSYAPLGVSLISDKVSTTTGSIMFKDVQQWTSTDHLSHAVDITYENWHNGVAGTPEWKFPGLTFATYATSAIVPTATFPTGPFTATAKYDPTSTTTADPTKPFGFEVYSQKPVAVWFKDPEDAVYELTGTATSTTPWVVHFGATQGDTQALAEASSDALVDWANGPAIVITSPTANKVLYTRTTLVKGTSTDNKAVTSVKVNGKAATLLSTGAWSRLATLVAGANTLTATAMDAQGNSTSAIVKVTTKCKVPRLRGATPKFAKATLAFHFCGVKSTVAIRSKVRKGRVVKTSPKAGAIRKANTKVTLYVSKG